MSDKRTKKTQQKIKKKKASKNRKTPTLKLDNRDEIPAKTTYMENTECFDIDKIDIDKIRVPDKRLHSKQHKSYKYYVFYEHNDGYIPLKIILIDAVGY